MRGKSGRREKCPKTVLLGEKQRLSPNSTIFVDALRRGYYSKGDAFAG